MFKSGVEEHTCCHYISQKLSVIWTKNSFHVTVLYKTNSAASHLFVCNLQITSSCIQCEASASFRKPACTIRVDILSGWPVNAYIPQVNLQVCCFLPARNLKQKTAVAGRRKETQGTKQTTRKKLVFVTQAASRKPVQLLHCGLYLIKSHQIRDEMLLRLTCHTEV